jgi:pyruvate formate lyase activating enzyme
VRIAGIQGLSLIDYPGKVASVLFVAGCDFRCPFCQNPDLVKVNAELPRCSPDEAVAFLHDRQKLIDGIVITGGEPLLSPGMPELIARLADEIGVPIKLDTNGNHPDLLRQVIEQGRLAYVAMDLKAPLSRYAEAAGTLVDVGRIEESIAVIRDGGTAYEFRTTVVPGLIDDAGIDEMGRTLHGARLWVLQQYQNRIVLDETYAQRRPYPPEKVRAFALRAEPFVEQVTLRGL